MDRESRVLHNKKQTNIKVSSGGVPSPSEITKPEIRRILNYGVYLIANIDGKLHFLKFSETL